jgi:hypothetical protein
MSINIINFFFHFEFYLYIVRINYYFFQFITAIIDLSLTGLEPILLHRSITFYLLNYRDINNLTKSLRHL